MSDLKRRDFLKVLGAGSAGIAAAGCSTKDVTRLIPYVVQAEEIVPGLPTWYASTCRECPAGCGVLVETHSGRATKLEGNPNNPISHGNLCARGQASVQGLYNPDRIPGPRISQGVEVINATWGTAERLVVERIQAEQAAGREVVFLTKRYGGTMDSLVDQWVAAAGARRVVYETYAPQPNGINFTDAGVLVSFGADFLETWGSTTDYAWQFSQFHAFVGGRRGKFIWVGPHRPLTGLNADQWISPRPGTEIVLARALAGQVDPASAAQQTGVSAEVIQTLVQEFNAGNGVALGPGAAISGANASELADVINGLNAGRAGVSSTPAVSPQPVAELVEQMRAGRIGVLLVDAPNPVYSLPAGLGFAEAYASVPTRVSFSAYPDETTAASTHQLPNHHFLEAWDDQEVRPSVVGLVQPSMRPVFNTKQVGDVLISLARQLGIADFAGGASTYYDFLRARWASIAPGEDGWRTALQNGGVYNAAVAAPAVAPALAGDGAPITFQGDGDLHLVVYPSSRYYDGSTANRPWLLELPDPVLKVAWESVAELHPVTATRLGISQGDVIEVSTRFGSVQTFAFVWPGVRQDSVAIQAGLGHQEFGRFARGVGVNPNALLSPLTDTRTGQYVSYGHMASVSRVSGPIKGGVYNPGPGLFEQGVRIQHDREFSKAISVAELAALSATSQGVIPGSDVEMKNLRGAGGFLPTTQSTDPAAFPPPGTHYGEYIPGNTRWAMVIDLERCTGCAACVTACYAENNIPVVGPNEFKRGRDLSWMRIERYWGVTQDENEALADHAIDDTRFLPMLCQHCGNAPCEPVCPVYAAYHTPDGLNGQVYNRCVGTRYCANNCPFKVRYFNWFTYEFAEPLNWQLNPDVAVREKGVMEKCTFCVQRIREKERAAALENRTVADGEVVPACVQTCPSEVLVFGNIQDPDSAVARAAASVRSYRVLEEINVQPAIVYKSKVTLFEPARGGHHSATAEAH
ncbi:MAG: 4Fe-4S dicluster domain-containing protein [Gemmatimonadota bacterium]|jgi:molybdopterin-containing oxidoreductase family iron-sulfur binding subunit|nr:4Fe-4S dicluster domain-containing protein [Gemmatimonadota bacterium]